MSQTSPQPSETAPQPPAETKTCPYCLETIKAKAIKCRYCGEFLDGRGAPLVPAPDTMPAGHSAPITPAQPPSVQFSTEKNAPPPESKEVLEKEEILLTIHSTWKTLLAPSACFFLIACVTFVVAIQGQADKTWLIRGGLLLLFLDFVWFSKRALHRIFTVYTITTLRLRFNEGFITRNEVEVRHKDIRATWLRQTITERLFDYGDIHIGTSATAETELSLDNVDNPKRILDLINQLYQGKKPLPK